MKKLLLIFCGFAIHWNLLSQNATELITNAYNILNQLKGTDNPIDFELKYQQALSLIQRYESEANKPPQTDIIYYMSKALDRYHLQYPADFRKHSKAALGFITDAQTIWVNIGKDRRYPEYIRAYLQLNKINDTVFQKRIKIINARLEKIRLPLDTLDSPTYPDSITIDRRAIEVQQTALTRCYQKIKTLRQRPPTAQFSNEVINVIKNFEKSSFSTQKFVKLSLNSVYLYCKSWIFMQELDAVTCVSDLELQQINNNLQNAQLYMNKIEKGSFASAAYISSNMKTIGMTSQVIHTLKAQIELKSNSKIACPPSVTAYEMREILQIKQKLMLDLEDFKKIAQVPAIFLANEPIKFLVEVPQDLTFKTILDYYQAADVITKDVYLINLKSLNQDFLNTYDNNRTLDENSVIPMKPNMRFLWLTNPAGMGIFKGSDAVIGRNRETSRIIEQTAYSIFNNK